MLYKVTDKFGRTRGGTQWGKGVENIAVGPERQWLCTDGWIHAYTDPLVATFVWRAHVGFDAPRLWEAEGEVGLADGLKVGCRRLRTIREIPWPAVTTEQRVRFAIACAWPSAPEAWQVWAQRWLTGEDRTAESLWKLGANAKAWWLVAMYATRVIQAATTAAAAAEKEKEKARAAWAAAETHLAAIGIDSETVQAVAEAKWAEARAAWETAVRITQDFTERAARATAETVDTWAFCTTRKPDSIALAFNTIAAWALTTSTEVPVL